MEVLCEGAIVVHRAGGPRMVLLKVVDDAYLCSWQDGNTVNRQHFERGELDLCMEDHAPIQDDVDYDGEYHDEVDRSIRIATAENDRQTMALAVATIGLTIIFYNRPIPPLGQIEGYFVGAGLILTAISVLSTYLSMYASVRAHEYLLANIVESSDDKICLHRLWLRYVSVLTRTGIGLFISGAVILFISAFVRLFHL
jgi:uncharacterized protein YodC (DUF2158 family)